jgi:hypothetical protein
MFSNPATDNGKMAKHESLVQHFISIIIEMT